MAKVDIVINVLTTAEGAIKVLDRLSLTLKKQQKDWKDIAKTAGVTMKDVTYSFKNMESAASRAGTAIVRSMKLAFSETERIWGNITRVTSKVTNPIGGALSAVFSMPHLLMGGLVGGGLMKMWSMGRDDRRMNRMVKRQFGAQAGPILEIAERYAMQSGMGTTDFIKALLPSARAAQVSIRAGIPLATRKGKRTIATDALAGGEQLKAIEFSARQLRNIKLAGPDDVGTEETGLALAMSGRDPEAIKRLAMRLGMDPRMANDLVDANEKGHLLQSNKLTAAEKLKFNVKKGEVLGGGDINELLLNRLGITNEAANEEQQTPEFAAEQAKTALLEKLGDIGQSLIETVGELIPVVREASRSLERLLNFKPGTTFNPFAAPETAPGGTFKVLNGGRVQMPERKEDKGKSPETIAKENAGKFRRGQPVIGDINIDQVIVNEGKAISWAAAEAIERKIRDKTANGTGRR